MNYMKSQAYVISRDSLFSGIKEVTGRALLNCGAVELWWWCWICRLVILCLKSKTEF